MVQKYLPPFEPLYTLHPDKVVTMGAFGMPEIYTEAKKALDVAMWESAPVVVEAWDELAQLTGRQYKPVETYKAEEAETLILAMGSICETASLAVDEMRKNGKKIGLVNLRLWRPLPKDDLRKVLSSAKDVIVLDRALTPGGANSPLTEEIRSLMYGEAVRPNIYNIVAGLGGRDVTPADITNMVEKSLADKHKGYYIYGVRG